MSACVVHWDLENQQIPSGSTVTAVANRIRDAVQQHHSVISDSFVYCNTAKLGPTVRSELAMVGYDVLDCSSSSGKPGQVDLRIIARALKPRCSGTPQLAVCIVSGDGDFAYCVSCLRNAGVPTMILYNSDRRSIVHTTLIEASLLAVGVSFSGVATRQSEIGGCEEEEEEEEEEEDTPAHRKDLAPLQISFLEAVERVTASSDGWRRSTEVGCMFRKLNNDKTTKQVFKATKHSLVLLHVIEVDTKADSIRALPTSV